MRGAILSLFLFCTVPAYGLNILSPGQVNQQVFNESPRLIMLWSVDCPPCYQELAMLKKLLVSHPDLPITLISTDDDRERYAEVAEEYQQLAGNKLNTWVFSDGQGHQLRYAVDPQWSGVLPRSYFITSPNERLGHSGVLEKKNVLSLFSKSTGK